MNCSKNTYWFIAFNAGGTFGNIFVEYDKVFINIREMEMIIGKEIGAGFGSSTY